MICQNCGADLDNHNKFCPQCGASVTKTIVPATFLGSIETRHPFRKGKVIGALLLLAVIALVIAVIVETPASSDKDHALSSAATSPVANMPDSDMAAPSPAGPAYLWSDATSI